MKDTKQSHDIIDLILEDHKPLKELIKILKDTEADPGERFTAFEKFAPLLNVHSKPEEQSLYAHLKKDDELRVDALEGDAEHAISDLLLHEIFEVEDKDMWSAKVKVLAELVENHIKGEEHDLLPAFKKNSDEKLRLELGGQFLHLKTVVGHGLPLRKVLSEEIYWEQGQHQ